MTKEFSALYVVAVGATLLSPQPATAQSGDNIEQALAICAIYKDDTQRLRCYDILANTGSEPDSGKDSGSSASLPPELQTDGPTGKWLVDQKTNPVDDTTTVQVALAADEGTSAYGNSIVFIARCQSNKTEAYIVWNDYLASDSHDVYSSWKNVTVRIGDAPAQTQRWGVSTDNEATFAPEWAGTLLKQMVKADRFVAQVTPYDASPATAVFDTTGMATALKPLLKTCDWSLE